MTSVKDLDLSLSADDIMARITSRRGPYPGWGCGPGRPWRGLVEETPAFWVTWLVALARKLGLNPDALNLTWYGVPFHLATTELTFGTRYYFLCPRCERRCEALYYAGAVGCRVCHHLGYRSQAHRAGSIHQIFDLLHDRDFISSHWRRWDPPDPIKQFVVGELAELARTELRETLDALGVGRQMSENV